MLEREVIFKLISSMRPGITRASFEIMIDTAVKDRIHNLLAEAGLWSSSDEMAWPATEEGQAVKDWIYDYARSRLSDAYHTLGVS